MAEKIRPPFVKHTVAIMLVVGIVFMGLFSILLPLVIYSRSPSEHLFLAIAMISITIEVAIFISAYGLLTMKRWARKVAIGTIIATIALSLGGGFLVFIRSLQNLTKPETKTAFGEKLSKGEVEERRYKAREAKRICEECGAKDVTLHDAKGKLVCHDCWEKLKGWE